MLTFDVNAFLDLNELSRNRTDLKKYQIYKQYLDYLIA